MLRTRHALTFLLCAAIAGAAAAAPVNPDIRTVQPDQLHNYWVMTNTSLNVDVPNTGINIHKPTCAAVTYTIGSDGVTRHIVVRRVVPGGDLEITAESAVKDMHYVPGADNATRDPVFTYIIIPFNLPDDDPTTRKQITAPCVLPHFPKGYR